MEECSLLVCWLAVTKERWIILSRHIIFSFVANNSGLLQSTLLWYTPQNRRPSLSQSQSHKGFLCVDLKPGIMVLKWMAPELKGGFKEINSHAERGMCFLPGCLRCRYWRIQIKSQSFTPWDVEDMASPGTAALLGPTQEDDTFFLWKTKTTSLPLLELY